MEPLHQKQCWQIWNDTAYGGPLDFKQLFPICKRDRDASISRLEISWAENVRFPTLPILQNQLWPCSHWHASICSAPIENTQEFTSPWLPSDSNYCRLLQILVLPPRNRAMEPAAVTHSTTAHFWFLQEGSVHGQSPNAINVIALFFNF